MESVACELCASTDAEEAFRQRDLTHHTGHEEFRVVRCRDCGLLYLNPRPSPAEIGRYYPEQYFPPAAGPDRPRRRSRVKRWALEAHYGYPAASGQGRLFRWLISLPYYLVRRARGRDVVPWAGRGRILDLGCGAGVNLPALLEQGWDAQGLDVSEVAVRVGQARFGSRVRHGDLQSVRFQDRSFDAVLCSHSLEHMYTPLSVLREIHRILDDEGLLVLILPNAGSLEARLFGRWWFPWELPRHLYHFDRRTVTQLLQRAGFRIRRLTTGKGSLFFMASLDRVWHKRFARPIPGRRLLEKLVGRPLCLVAGHLGWGTELMVYAVKSRDHVPRLQHGSKPA